MCLRVNKLAINTTKTKIIVFHPFILSKKKLRTFRLFLTAMILNSFPDPRFIFHIERIQRFWLFKCLAFFLMKILILNYHIKQTRNKISKALFLISKAKHLLSSSALKSLCYALVHPLFLYCLPIYSSASLKSLNSLFLLQKKVCQNYN